VCFGRRCGSGDDTSLAGKNICVVGFFFSVSCFKSSMVICFFFLTPPRFPSLVPLLYLPVFLIGCGGVLVERGGLA